MSQVENQKSPTGPHARLTADLPGVGGALKQRLEDFLVEEQPLYQPCGKGEHVYLFVEKHNVATPDAVRRIAKAFRVRQSDVGYAGLKDKRAVTRQHVSVYLPDADDEAVADSVRRCGHHPNLNVLWTDRHTNKLRLGHLAGNRFVIYLRKVEPTHVVRAKAVLDQLEQRGMPNYFGEQRFGYRGNSDRVGRAILVNDARAALDELLGKPGDAESPKRRRGREAYEHGDYDTALQCCPKKMRYERQALDALRQGKTPDDALAAVDRNQRSLMLSAWQSARFNRVLDARLRDGSFDRLQPGDLAQKHRNRAVFAVDPPTAELENGPDGRIRRFEISPSGPMWGPDMPRAAGDVDALECRALEEDGLRPDQLRDAPAANTLRGQRRPLRVPLSNCDVSGGVDDNGPYIRLAFDLPRGAFATIALDEIMKPPPPEASPGKSPSP